MYFTDKRVKDYVATTMNVTKKLGWLAGVSGLILAGAASAHADGFLCGTFDRELLVQVSRPAGQSRGTPKPMVMTLSDPSAPQGRQLIGQFNQTDINHTQRGPVFEASVVGGIPGPNEYVGGARLSELRWIILGVNLASSNPAEYGGIIPGSLTLQKANGQIIQKLVTCTPINK